MHTRNKSQARLKTFFFDNDYDDDDGIIAPHNSRKYTRHMGRDHTEIKHFTHIQEMINVTMSDMTSRMRVTILQIPTKHCVQCSAISYST